MLQAPMLTFIKCRLQKICSSICNFKSQIWANRDQLATMEC